MIARTLTMQRGVLLALASALIVAPLLGGCSDESYDQNAASDQASGTVGGTESAENSPSGAFESLDRFAASSGDASSGPHPIRILALGDSLTAGYGLDDPSQAFPARLEQVLTAAGHNVTVLDAGISGDTTAGGRSRLDWSLSENPDAVIVELGGNDGLRAIDPDVTYDNLDAILSRLNQDGIPVLLAGMLAPPNLGRDYGDRFQGVYERLAEQYDVVFYPFFLDGVAGDPALNQPDQIHPTADGVDVIVERITPYVERLVDRAMEKRKSGSSS